MGAKTVEQIRQNRIKYASIDRESGLLMIDGQEYGAIEGKLLGFNSHTFDFKGTPQKKFDVYLFDDGIYQVQVGFYSWVNFRLLNQLINIPDLKNGGVVEIATNMQDDNVNVFVRFNGVYLKHKYKYADLKFDGKDKDARVKHRDKIIDKWYSFLMELKPYDENAHTPPSENTSEAGAEKDDDLPF